MSITVFHQTAALSGLQEQGAPARPTRGEWRIDETLRKVFVVMALGC